MGPQEKRILFQISNLTAIEREQREKGDIKYADGTAQQIEGLKLELAHMRGEDPARPRS